MRFSDIQRSHLSSWQLDHESLRGLTWRAKTSTSATPFGALLSGLLSKGTWTWVHKLLQTLDHLYQNCDIYSIDFAIPSFGSNETPIHPFQPMTYGEALYFLRFYLALPWSSAASTDEAHVSHYTIHGLKCTLLSWANQLNLSEEDRRVHGKHKPASQSVALCSRDDIIGSLRLQKAIVESISNGWKPATPLGRGGQTPIQEPAFTMERFKKNAGDLTWMFFRFHQSTAFPRFGSETIEEQDESHQALNVSSDSSSSSSSSSSESDQTPKPWTTTQSRFISSPPSCVILTNACLACIVILGI